MAELKVVSRGGRDTGESVSETNREMREKWGRSEKDWKWDYKQSGKRSSWGHVYAAPFRQKRSSQRPPTVFPSQKRNESNGITQFVINQTTIDRMIKKPEKTKVIRRSWHDDATGSFSVETGEREREMQMAESNGRLERALYWNDDGLVRFRSSTAIVYPSPRNYYKSTRNTRPFQTTGIKHAIPSVIHCRLNETVLLLIHCFRFLETRRKSSSILHHLFSIAARMHGHLSSSSDPAAVQNHMPKNRHKTWEARYRNCRLRRSSPLSSRGY